MTMKRSMYVGMAVLWIVGLGYLLASANPA